MHKELRVFFMSADEVAEAIVLAFGKIKIEILRELTKTLGVAKIAKVAGTRSGSIATALARNSLGDDLAYKVFKGVAEEYPEVLKSAIEIVLKRYEKIYESMGVNLDKLIKKKIERAVKLV